ncbi:MAG: LptF/LptG family permease [Proteobacteria bacterium]|nr:LptF/LptG family permease [Pseudomonadota bacterium]MBU1714849.1 LptF/LptG family permease [Pseudomonadota bacterium]
MPFLLYTYLFAEMAAPLVATLIVLTGILFLGKLVPFLNIILQFHVGFADFLRICIFMLPKLLWFSFPFAAMLGVTLCFTRLSNDTEILALKASGVTVNFMLPPVIVVALSMALLSFFNASHLVPAGSNAMNDIFLKLAREKIEKGIVAGEFSENLGDIVLYTETLDPKTNELGGVYLSDSREGDTPVVIMARQGFLVPLGTMMQLTLRDGSIHRVIDELDQTITFQKYTLNIPLEIDKISGLKVSRSNMTLPELKAKAEEHGIGSKTGALFMAEFYKRITLPVGCFLLSLLAFPFGLLANTERPGIGVRLTLAVFISYYILTSAAESLSAKLIVPVLPALWFPNLLFAVLTVFLIFRANREEQTIIGLPFKGVFRKIFRKK